MRKGNTWLILTLVNSEVPANALWHWRAWHGVFHIYPITLFSEQWPPANCLSLHCASSQTLPKNYQENSSWPRLKSLQRLFLQFNCMCAYYWMSIFPGSKSVMSYYHVFRICFDTFDVKSQICLRLFCFVLLVLEKSPKDKNINLTHIGVSWQHAWYTKTITKRNRVITSAPFLFNEETVLQMNWWVIFF